MKSSAEPVAALVVFCAHSWRTRIQLATIAATAVMSGATLGLHAQVRYSNAFQEGSASLAGMTVGQPGTGTVSVAGGQLDLSPGQAYVDHSYVTLDLRTLNQAIDGPLSSLTEPLSIGFCVSNQDGSLNNMFAVNLISRSDPNDSAQYGYVLRGGGLLGNRFELLQQASTFSPFGNVYQELIASDDGLVPLPSVGSFRLTYRPTSDRWDLYFEQGSTPKDPLSVSTLVGSAPAGAFSGQPLPYLNLQSQTTGHAYFDNLYVATGSGPTMVSGLLSADTTWRAQDGPFVISGNVEVPADGTLTIEPGVRIIYKAANVFVIRGKLIAEGTAAEPIVFTSYTLETSSGATMVKFEGANLSQSSIRNCVFSLAARGLQVGDGGEFDPRSPCTGVLTVSDSVFDRAEVRTAGYDSQGRLVLVDCTITSSTVIGEFARSEPIDLVGTILRNAVVNADAYNKGITLNGCYSEGTEFRIGCCGGTFVIDDSEFLSSAFVDGYGQPIMGPLVIRGSILKSTSVNLPSASLTLQDSIVDFSGASTPLFKVGSATIDSSAFIGNGTGTGIQVTGDFGYSSNGSIRMSNSRVTDFEVGLRVGGGAASTVADGNVFQRNAVYHIQNLNNDAIAASGNYWDTNIAAEIATKIFDHTDDILYGVVDTSGLLAEEPAILTLSGLQQTYDGTPREVTVTVRPSCLVPIVTYDGASSAPTNAGSYAVVGTIHHPKLARSQSDTMVVSKAEPTLVWADPTSITYGTLLSDAQLNANSSVPGTIAYAPVQGTRLSAGQHTLQARLTPADLANYTTSEKSVLLTVTKAVPVIEWPTPTSITYGTRLSAAQLNASASVAGTWMYSPAAGALLGAGSHSLQVAFTPSDEANFEHASAEALLTVDRAVAAVNLGSLFQRFDGTAKPVVVKTTPENLSVVVTYDGAQVVPTVCGTYSVSAVVSDANFTGSATGQLTVAEVIVETESSNIAAGGDLTLRANASETASSFQWQRRRAGDGTWVDIVGATSATLILRAMQYYDAGEYCVIVREGGNVFTSPPVSVLVNAVTTSGAVLRNLSARAVCRDGDAVLIPGFVVEGAGEKHLLIRAVGPTLALDPYDVPGVLPNPRMALQKYDSTTRTYSHVAANDDWQSAANASEIESLARDIGAFPLEDSSDAALAERLAAGMYTVVTHDVQNRSGIALMELYDAEVANGESRLINFSNRGYAGGGAEVMIVGFVVGSEGPIKLMIRVVGPTLAKNPYNISGTMTDPQLALYRSDGEGLSSLLFVNDNWGSGPVPEDVKDVASAVGAFPLEEGSSDAALVLTLDPGVYTIHAGSTSVGGSGVVLTELYLVP